MYIITIITCHLCDGRLTNVQDQLTIHHLAGDRTGYLQVFNGQHLEIGPEEMRSHVHSHVSVTSLATVAMPAISYIEAGVVNYGGMYGIDRLFVRGSATLYQWGYVESLSLSVLSLIHI